MPLESVLKAELKKRGADFVYFADISKLSHKQNKGYPNAILFGIVLSPDYIKEIASDPDYKQKMVCNRLDENDEFHQKEEKTDKMADEIAKYLEGKGFSTYSQSERNIYSTGFYDEKTKTTPLPHKTIAILADLGWIGKHNLLVTNEFGSAISMCTVLTDAPLETVVCAPRISQCGNCSVCMDICPVGAIGGAEWNINTLRDELLDVHKCITCLKCLAFCPWTQAFVKRDLLNKF